MTTIDEALDAAETELLTKTYPTGPPVPESDRAMNGRAADVLRRHIPRAIKVLLRHGSGVGEEPFSRDWTTLWNACIETQRLCLDAYPTDVFLPIPRKRQAGKAATSELMREYVPAIIGRVRDVIIEEKQGV